MDNAAEGLLVIKELKEGEVKRIKWLETTKVYDIWRNKVQKVITEVKKLKEEYQSARIPRWRVFKRSHLSDEMAKKVDQIEKLIKEGQNSNGFLIDKHPERVLKIFDVPDIKEFPTLQRPLDEILVSLRNKNIQRIGVLGSVGVGKTTILQNLNNHEEVANMFDMVIFLKASSKQTVVELQQAITGRLKIKTECISNIDEVGDIIYEELKSKRYLLLLDDVTGKLNLEKVGIPSHDGGSKVILVAKDRSVLRQNNLNKLVTVQLLSEQEAWQMFEDIVVEVIDLPDIRPIAYKVCKWCARLPLLIKAIASSFKLKETASSWRSGLRNLQFWPDLKNQGLSEVFAILRFCYDNLMDENKQKCLLYSALYPEESNIDRDYLVECFAAQGFLGEINDTRPFQHARDDGNSLVEHLIDVSLLEKGERMKYVRMNGFIRQLALYISSEDSSFEFYVRDKGVSSRILKFDSWEEAQISVAETELHQLPQFQDYSKILALVLRENPELCIIPHAFFQDMKSLRLLDFYGTRIGKLPSSLSGLTSLKGLYLNGCKFLTVLPPHIGLLRGLQVLDTRDTKVPFIPSCIKCLVNLRCLKISYFKRCHQEEFEEARQAVISYLLKLEELIVEVAANSYDQWCQRAKVIIGQVASSKNLTTLIFCFPTTNILRNFVNIRKPWKGENPLCSFQFSIGCQNTRCPEILEIFDYEISRCLSYCNGVENDDLKIAKVLAESDAFELICHKDIKTLSEFVSTASFNHLRGCLIESCNEMNTIINDQGTNKGSILPELEHLHLRNLPKLVGVFMHCESLHKLRTVTLKNCPALKSLFRNIADQQFSELQKLTIEDCKEIEELLTESEASGWRLFPKLKTLVLMRLRKLRSICRNRHLTWPSLEVLKVQDCPALKIIPFTENNSPNLWCIEGKQKWWNDLQWEDNDVKQSIQSKFKHSDQGLQSRFASRKRFHSGVQRLTS